MPPKKKSAGETVITIPQMKRDTVTVTLCPDSAVIAHKPSEENKEKIRAKQQKRATTAREARDPEAEYEAATYKFPDGAFGLPAIWFKKSMIESCRYIDGVSMAIAKGAFFVQYDGVDYEGNQLVNLEGARTIREDVVRLSSGVMDLRYRPQFQPWLVELRINYNINVLSKEQLLNLLQHAGFHVGGGDWRPQGKASTGTGQFGTYHVAESAAEIAQVRKQIKAAEKVAPAYNKEMIAKFTGGLKIQKAA